MPGNPQPIFSRVGDVTANSGAVSTGKMGMTLTIVAGDYTGQNGNNQIVFTSDATNGSFIQKLRFKALGTNVATVARIYLNNGGSQALANNNAFIGEISLPATTAIATAATVDLEYPLNIALNPGFQVLCGLGTAVAAGWVVTGIGGKY